MQELVNHVSMLHCTVCTAQIRQFAYQLTWILPFMWAKMLLCHGLAQKNNRMWERIAVRQMLGR
jgi:hypothetical protein